jgi:ubiquinol-cytochrome c reductase cytochrome c1 subunit
MFAGGKVGDEMNVAMRSDVARSWFGVAPPDLSVIARSRGANWLYTYLVTFYADDNPARPFGVNNAVFRDVGMPHVLWPLQGVQSMVRGETPADVQETHLGRIAVDGDDVALYKTVVTGDGIHHEVVDRLRVTTPGEMGPGQFRKAARDLANFLVYAAEPAQLVRYRVGIWVLLFLAVLFLLSRALYKEYWKDIH